MSSAVQLPGLTLNMLIFRVHPVRNSVEHAALNALLLLLSSCNFVCSIVYRRGQKQPPWHWLFFCDFNRV